MSTTLSKLFYLCIGLLLLAIIFGICLILILKVLTKIMDLKNLRLSKKLARLKYNDLKLSYEGLIVFRREHYKAKMAGDLNKQKKFEDDYNMCRKSLSNYDKDEEFIQYLKEEEQKEVKRILSLPRYSL